MSDIIVKTIDILTLQTPTALIVILALWFVVQVRRIAAFLSLAQLKEFRFDRVRSWLKTDEGLSFVLHPWTLLKTVVWGISFFPRLLPFCFYSFFLIFLIEGIATFFSLITKKIKRPTITRKILVQFFLFASIVGVITLYCFFFTNDPLSLSRTLLTADRLLPFVIVLSIGVLIFVNNASREKTIQALKSFLVAHKNLTTIAITGSYGKSSTKEFLATLIGDQEKTLVVPKNINTEIGIAEFILKNLKTTHRYLIVEIGAYRIGEIKHIGSALAPSISILTAIGNQHLDLFGSQANIIKAKFEIGAILKKDGTLIVNANNEHIRKHLPHFKKTRPDVEIKKVSRETKNDYYATQIKQVVGIPSGISFSLNDALPLQTNLIAPDFITNALLAIATAKELKIIDHAIQNNARKLTQPEHTLKIIEHGIHDALIIDDSYSSNEQGVIEAFELARKIKRKNKILIMRPLIELGTNGHKIHFQLAQSMAQIFDHIIFTSYDYEHDLKRGLRSKNFATHNAHWIKESASILKIVGTIANIDTLILLENRLPELAVKKICT